MPKKPEDRLPTVPTSFAETTPVFPSGDFSYTLEVVMEMQKTLGAHTQAVTTLTDEVKGLRTKVDKMSHIIYAAGVVGTILLAVGVWLLNKMADVVISHFAVSPK